jgi:hypothetical protein
MWRGVVVIVSANRTENRRFESLQGVKVSRTLYIVLLPFVNLSHCHCVYLSEMNAKKLIFKN